MFFFPDDEGVCVFTEVHVSSSAACMFSVLCVFSERGVGIFCGGKRLCGFSSCPPVLSSAEVHVSVALSCKLSTAVTSDESDDLVGSCVSEGVVVSVEVD